MKNHHPVLFILSCVVIFMLGFCFALVPLYNRYCKITGINTSLSESEYAQTPDFTRDILLQMLATPNANLPWDFRAATAQLHFHPGSTQTIYYFAKNNSANTMTAQAIPSFTPPEAARYFHKIECFCFTQQTLKSGEEKQMPVVFRIDKNIPAAFNTITLAYTLYAMPLRKIL